MDKFIPKSELVNTLGISTRTLENWIAQRAFPAPLHLAGSRLSFFDMVAVQAWLERELNSEGQA